MLKINRYVDIDTVEREARKDYIDRHSAFIKCETTAKKGEIFSEKIHAAQPKKKYKKSLLSHVRC